MDTIVAFWVEEPVEVVVSFVELELFVEITLLVVEVVVEVVEFAVESTYSYTYIALLPPQYSTSLPLHCLVQPVQFGMALA